MAVAENADDTGEVAPAAEFKASGSAVEGSIADLPDSLQRSFDPNHMDAAAKDALSMILESLKHTSMGALDKGQTSLLHQVRNGQLACLDLDNSSGSGSSFWTA